MMPINALVTVIVAALAAAGAWTFRSAQADADLAELRLSHANDTIKRQAVNREVERSIAARYQGALNAARSQQMALRRDADAARAESDGLRQQLTGTARRLAEAPPAAVLEYATALGDVLDQCQRGYQGLAAKADGHTGDLRTLTEAWPR